MSSAEVWVRHSSMRNYDGLALEIGQVFTMRNAINDGKLLENGYVIELDKDTTKGVVECIGCGSRFVGESYRFAHALHAQHDALVVDGPQLKGVKPKLNIMANGSDRDLEPEGAPPPVPVGAGAPVAAEHGSRPVSTAKGAGEVFRLG